jgi:type II secretory pathway component PulK
MNCPKLRYARRPGAAMLTALALLAFVFLIAAALLAQVVSQERAAQDYQRQLQVGLLAESAWERAAARATGNAEYMGETWEPEWQAGEREQTGRARIEVQRDPSGKSARVTVTAEYPVHPVNRAQTVLKRSLPLPPTK